MGKMADYAKKHLCRPLKDLSPRHLQAPSNARYSDVFPDVGLLEASDPLAGYVQVESLPNDINSTCARSFGRDGGRFMTLNNSESVFPGHSSQRRTTLGRSISVDESDVLHFNNRIRMTDSTGSDGKLTDSFCELDVPFNISSHCKPQPQTSGYSKNSFSQKLFGSYNPFEKLSSKSSSNSSSKTSVRNHSYNSPVRRGSVTVRQDSLDCSTIEMLSPILEQEKLCPDCQSWRSLVIVIAVRFGGDAFNTIYERVVKALLRHPLCVGLVGGKAKRAFYFVGYQG